MELNWVLIEMTVISFHSDLQKLMTACVLWITHTFFREEIAVEFCLFELRKRLSTHVHCVPVAPGIKSWGK